MKIMKNGKNPLFMLPSRRYLYLFFHPVKYLNFINNTILMTVFGFFTY